MKPALLLATLLSLLPATPLLAEEPTPPAQDNSRQASMLILCNRVATQINASLPSKNDEYTTWQSTSCTQDANTIRLDYLFILSETATELLTEADLQEELGKPMQEEFCNDPDTRMLLTLFDIQINFQTAEGTPVTTVRYSRSQCQP